MDAERRARPSATGRRRIPPLAAILGLSDPFLLLTGTADGAGSFAFAVPIPATASGVTLWLQSLELGASTAVVKRTIQ